MRKLVPLTYVRSGFRRVGAALLAVTSLLVLTLIAPPAIAGPVTLLDPEDLSGGYGIEASGPVETTLIDRTPHWDFGVGTGGGSIARSHEGSINPNNSALGLGDVPNERVATGFLNGGGSPKWEGMLFDTRLFQIYVMGSDDESLTESLLPFFEEDNRTAKDQGGNGSAWLKNHDDDDDEEEDDEDDEDSHNNTVVPEPAILTLLGLGTGMLFVARRKRRPSVN